MPARDRALVCGRTRAPLQAQRVGTVKRVSYAGFLCVYTLAAIFGLFLHSHIETAAPTHVCGAQHPDIERDSPGDHAHDAAHCGLCHTLERLANVLPDPPTQLIETEVESTALVPLPRVEIVSAHHVVIRSRAPPVTRVV